MKFNKIIESTLYQGHEGAVYREAARAIIFSDNHILLVHSNRGDYKFPGGGVEKNEGHEDAIVREVKEETGYINCMVKEKVGAVIERKVDEYDKSRLFQMTSHYYWCELSNKKRISQQLDDYEDFLEFNPKWVTLEEAITQNKKLMSQFQDKSWLKRETFVLAELKNELCTW